MQTGSRSPLSAIVGFVVSIAACFGAAVVGAWFTGPAITSGWYAALSKPDWAPPDWVFGPVWTVLYVMMAFAAWLVWKQSNASWRSAPLWLFAVQLSLNVVWSGIFFGLRQPGLAFGEIVMLWAAIAMTALLFWRAFPVAGLLLVPYLTWVTFAAALNFAVWRMNA